MADGALGQLAQNVFEGVADETKKTVKAAGTQLGVVNQKPKNIPTQQQINTLAAQKKVEDEAKLSEKRAELASLSTPQNIEQQAPNTAPSQGQKNIQAEGYMKQEAFVAAQRLGQAPRQERPRQPENPFPEKKTPPPLENAPSKGLFGVKKKKSNIALTDAQTKTEVKSGKLG